jgi:ATP-binding cassette, subfamily F, member 3
MIQLRDLTLEFGSRALFENINIVFQTADHIGIIGRNGAGKSTLLKVIAGLIAPSSGQVSVQKGMRIGYLPQEEVLGSTLNVFDEAFSAFSALTEAEKRINEFDEIIAQGNATADLLEEYADLQIQVQSFNKHEALQQTQEVLQGLGFSQELIGKQVSHLSTGWKMRLALAKLLLTDADMYLFDEPTNHLDIVTQQWFLQKLRSLPQGFLLVSHDRAYLEKACTSIFEIERGHGTFYRGNLSSYLQQKEAAIEIARATRARQEREIAQKQATVDRFRAGTRAQQAQNIMKQIERIELVEVEPPLPTINFHFPAPAQSGKVVLTFKDLAFEFKGKPLFHSVSGEIARSERIALLAANGVGKTTLISCLMGVYTPLKGTIDFGYNVQTAFFEQDQAQALNQNKTIFEEVFDSCPRVSDADIRKMLGSFLFSGDDVHKKIKMLSGGEKNRVAMVKVLLQRANFLILDEPTNHLDMYAKDVLLQALLAYQGSMLFVSHDIDFVSKLATRIFELTPNGLITFHGTYEEYQYAKNLQKHAETHLLSAHTSSGSKPSAPEQQKEVRKKIAELERTIEKLEKDEKKELNLLGGYEYGSLAYKQTLKRLEKTQKSLADAQQEWEKIIVELE